VGPGPFARFTKAEAEDLLDWLEANGLPVPENPPFWAGRGSPPGGGCLLTSASGLPAALHPASSCRRLAPEKPPMLTKLDTLLTIGQAARLFAQVGDPTRLRLLLVLRERGEACVGELAAALGMPQSGVSAHLMRLRWGKVVECERRGHHVFYRLASPFVTDLLRRVDGDGGPLAEA
jgi:DNA-binding transcriptional ArsR family regulator